MEQNQKEAQDQEDLERYGIRPERVLPEADYEAYEGFGHWWETNKLKVIGVGILAFFIGVYVFAFTSTHNMKETVSNSIIEGKLTGQSEDEVREYFGKRPDERRKQPSGTNTWIYKTAGLKYKVYDEYNTVVASEVIVHFDSDGAVHRFEYTPEEKTE